MATIYLFDTSSSHEHVLEDITDQADGIKLIFNTSKPYIPGSLVVFYSGVTYTKDNDFTETGLQEFTLLSGKPFPPVSTKPLVISYDVNKSDM